MKRFILGILFVIVFGMTSCSFEKVLVSTSSIESTQSTTSSSNKFTDKTGKITNSQKFLQAMSNCGFNADINLNKLEMIAKNKKLNGKSLYDNGLLYKATDLYGSSFAYGVLSDAVTYDERYVDGKQTYSYSLYMTASIENSYLPTGLTAGSTFKTVLNEFNVMDKYNSEKNNANRTIILNESNGEKVWLYFAGWHGRLTDNSLNNASATIYYSKEQDNIKLNGSLDFRNGKLTACSYSVEISQTTKTSTTNDKININLYQNKIAENLFEGSIKSMVITKETVTMTISVKSKTGKTENCKFMLEGWLSADNGVNAADFNFTATGTEELKTLTTHNERISLNNYIQLSQINMSISKGKVFINRSLSR